jgi:hypothetical protein
MVELRFISNMRGFQIHPRIRFHFPSGETYLDFCFEVAADNCVVVVGWDAISSDSRKNAFIRHMFARER